jgi:hypothetical protein
MKTHTVFEGEKLRKTETKLTMGDSEKKKKIEK